MNTLLENIGCLIELKRPNRDMLAASIGTTRQNLISAIKGRRPLPARYMPALRHALGLDDMNLLTNKQVHFMTVVDGEKQKPVLYKVLANFCHGPLSPHLLVRGIGEGKKESFAYVIAAKDGTLLFIRNDDGTLASWPIEEPDDNICEAFIQHIKHPTCELPLHSFNQLFEENIPPQKLHSLLNWGEKVWTWTRVQEQAEQRGMTPAEAARKLRLDETERR